MFPSVQQSYHIMNAQLGVEKGIAKWLETNEVEVCRYCEANKKWHMGQKSSPVKKLMWLILTPEAPLRSCELCTGLNLLLWLLDHIQNNDYPTPPLINHNEQRLIYFFSSWSIDPWAIEEPVEQQTPISTNFHQYHVTLYWASMVA